MKRRVFIVGCFSTGSSALSEVCRRLGYDMGDTDGPNYKNKFGNGEDRNLWAVAIQAFGGKKEQWVPEGLVEQGGMARALDVRDSAEGPWGVKLPHLGFFPLSWLRPQWAKDSVVIFTYRDVDTTMASITYHHANCPDTPETVAAYNRQRERCVFEAQKIRMPYLKVHFHTLIHYPQETIKQLAALLGVTDQATIEHAAATIDPEAPVFP